MATMEDLNDYCLFNIFSYVDIRERQRLALVCKKWQLINERIWKSMRKLEYMIVDSGSPRYISSIHKGVKVRYHDILHLGDILKKFNGNLEKLAITTGFGCDQPYDIPSWVYELIIGNQNLNSVEISVQNKRIYTECLKLLKTDNLRHLKLARHFRFKRSTSIRDAVEKVLKNAPRLETLDLYNISISMRRISEITTLKSLRINNSEILDLPVKKSNFINLKSIHLTRCQYVNDDFLKHLVKNCRKLCNVEVSECNSITLKGLTPITTLPELRHFAASQLNEEIFHKLSNLETFVCSALSLDENTVRAAVFNFFQRSPNLKVANVCLNADFYLINDYAEEFGIDLVQTGELHNYCYCTINWNKQFNG